MPADSTITVAAPVAHREPKQWLDQRLPYPPEYVEGVSRPLSTTLVDSIGADTVAPHIMTQHQAEIYAEQQWADSIVAARAYAEEHSGHAEGLPAEAMPPAFGQIDPLGVIVAASLAAAGLCAGGIRRALRSYRTALWSVRRRQNAFDDTHKAPLRASVMLAMLMVVFGGLALYCALPCSMSPTFAGAMCAVAAVGLYYCFQYCAYTAVGYAFATPQGRSMWLAGFVATQAYTGLTLVVPVLLMLFLPDWRGPLLWVCCALFLAGKLIFIGKGLRIFFHKIGSLLYFILYLCALEIIPVLALYAGLSWVEAWIAA